MPLEIVVFGIWVDLGYQNGSMLAPKSDGKSMLTSKGRCSKKCCKTNVILMIFEVHGVEVGRKSRPKIDQKTKSKMECLWASIFYDFDGFWWPSWNAKSTQIGLTWRGEASRRGVARRGEARRGEAWRDVAWKA